jgi:hypothetical protein
MEKYCCCSYLIKMGFFLQIFCIFIFVSRISSRQIRLSTPATPSQEDLDIKCLQILRTFVHNEERKLLADWDTCASDADVKK